MSLDDVIKFQREQGLSEEDFIEKIILQSMNEGVITLECDGKIFMSNPSALRILGLQEQDLHGKPFDSIFPDIPENREFRDIFGQVVHEGLPTLHKDVRFMRRDGQTVDLSISATFIETDVCLPELQNVVVVFRDVTAFKSLERMKRRAVDHLSHELRTPLSVIRATVDRLADNELADESYVKRLARIDRNLERLQNVGEIVQEILNPRPAQPRRVDVEAVITETLEEIRNAATHRSVEIRAGLETVGTADVDPDVLSLVLRTLVKNAVESTPDHSEVIVSVKKTEDGILLTVKDHGVGIPVADREFIFEGFHHTQNTEDYSSKKPFEFNAGGKGLELLHLQVLAENGLFDIRFESDRCRFIPTAGDHCPGDASKCAHIEDVQGCHESGGTTFFVLFPSHDSEARDTE
jgi:PAS domain S-box-containing protein